MEIAAWYAGHHPSGDERFFDAFSGARDLLAQYPHAGRERPELRASLRSWPVYPFVVFYEVDDAQRTVTIERVLHGRMDIDEDFLDA